MDPNKVLNHVLRLARLDTSVFEEVRDDVAELIPALVVAAISCLLAGLGAWMYWEVAVDRSTEAAFLNAFILGSVFLAAMYAVMVLVVYVVLVQIYKASADLTALFRTMGYAAVPISLSLLMFIPVLWPVFALVPLALLFVMSIYATQAATGADSKQVVMACTAGLTVMVVVLGIIALKMADVPDVPIGAGVFGTLIDLS